MELMSHPHPEMSPRGHQRSRHEKLQGLQSQGHEPHFPDPGCLLRFPASQGHLTCVPWPHPGEHLGALGARLDLTNGREGLQGREFRGFQGDFRGFRSQLPAAVPSLRWRGHGGGD